MKRMTRLLQILFFSGLVAALTGCEQPQSAKQDVPQVDYPEEAEINKNGWIIKASNVQEGVKFEINKPMTVSSLGWSAISKCSTDAAERHEVVGIIKQNVLLNDVGTSTIIFPFVNPDENTKFKIKIESNIGALEEYLYIKTSGGMGSPDYTNVLANNSTIDINIDKDKMSAEIKKYEMPDFSKVKLQTAPVSSLIDLHKGTDGNWLAGYSKDGWETNFELTGASQRIPFGESKIRINYLRNFKIVGNTSYDKYFDSFRLHGLDIYVDISSLYLTPDSMWYLRGKKYKSIEKYALPNLPDGAEAYVVVKFADLASGYNGVTGGAMIDFSKFPDIGTKWNSLKSSYAGAEVDDDKYTVILWNANEDTEETVQQRNCKGLPDLSKIMFTENGTTYTAVPF